MKSKRWIFWIVLALAQCGVPASMIIKAERVKRLGAEVRLVLAPIDPSDPFRGRYMALSFEIEREVLAKPSGLRDDVPLFLELTVCEDGFAKGTALSVAKPASGLYVEIPSSDWHEGPFDKKNGIRVRLPFRRFFVNETRAKAIEAAAQKLTNARRENPSAPPVFARARVSGGQVVLLSLEGPDGPLR
ncbi:GDYXXLXY domain-containing protein [Nibricoccus sp. IMCC34717]|uniref:GDYXXLXY domain-containing protein n=1 Tax=Nibricoccus sp. IMCC34717 TaxID=3034021 RepID=UPI00384DD0E1